MLSKEDQALIAYLGASGVAHRVTCTTDHPRFTSAGYISRHVMSGTEGPGLAIDASTPEHAYDSQGLANIFNAFLRVEHQLHELIYSGPQVKFSIKNGKRVPKYAVGGHHNHVHVSVDKGTFVHWPTSGLQPPQEVMKTMTTAVDFDFTPSGKGYIILLSDGGVVKFGDALKETLGTLKSAYGATKTPATTIKITPSGNGYGIAEENGGYFPYGDAPKLGSAYKTLNP